MAPPVHRQEGLDYASVLDIMNYEFGNSHPETVRIAVLVFGRPKSKVIREFVVPNLDYWHYRSEDYVDFFCIGFGGSEDPFDTEAFVNTVKEFEERSTWQYKGETEVLILNVRYDPKSQRAMFDFSTVVALTLEPALKKKAIESIPSFFEQIIKHAESYYGDDPTSAFSDLAGGKLVLSQVLKSALSFLPAKIGELIEKLLHFYTKDFSKT